ncbi:MAG TPA: MBL fold metallo-hydrolase [Gemmatimonadaceae bacterium]|nr:MBL fold metallo-hydrolase [Gemmatimonadaceae bacterium]
MRRILTTAGLVLIVGLLGGPALHAQPSPYSAELLSMLRRAATLSPGEPPNAVHVVSLNPFSIPMSYMVEGGSEEQMRAANPVFQIRFPRGWIMVDASVDRALAKSTTFDDGLYRRVHAALRDARLVVVTHEHADHATGIIRSPFLAQIQRHALLTRAQVRELMEHPNNPDVRLDSATAARYLTIDYASFVPIAPGVVLLKAAGHTPGSQMVYVRLSSGQEIVLAGDVAWNSLGFETQRQKPEQNTRNFGGEDRAAIAEQLRWLHDIAAPRTAVVVAHDAARIDTLVRRGVLRDGLDLSRP